ncbi:MAG TPA: lysophospholipid acyltransferase family protein [Steroidobacteraceae bacterium]|nr:lysophospholipid acyltransferase family protein [Steroidobacteraceae bacterium]
MQILGSLFFTTFMFAWTFLCAVVFVVAAPFLPFPRRFGIVGFWARATLGVLRFSCRLDYRVEGREHLPRGNHVALWKHSSAWETVAISAVLPRQVWVLKRELLWIPVVGWAIRLLHAIAIDRTAGSSAVNQVVEQGRQRLEEGDWVVVFPEGTRMPAGETRRYGVSGALLASKTGRLVVPVAHNAGYFWPRRGLLKRRGTIRVVIGPPIESAGRDPREINEQAQRWVEAQMLRLAPAAGPTSP